MLGAFDAIRGHKSAHSLATGPFTVEPGKKGSINLNEQGRIMREGVRVERVNIPVISRDT